MGSFRLFHFIENIFYISLVITFGLLLMLVYHFKQRINQNEQKTDKIIEIINGVVRELSCVKQQQFQQPSFSFVKSFGVSNNREHVGLDELLEEPVELEDEPEELEDIQDEPIELQEYELLEEPEDEPIESQEEPVEPQDEEPIELQDEPIEEEPIELQDEPQEEEPVEPQDEEPIEEDKPIELQQEEEPIELVPNEPVQEKPKEPKKRNRNKKQ